jgi:TatD DNase family protein
MHCFGAGWEEAKRALNMGFLVSFAGNVTYPKAQQLRDVASQMPLDGILVETDAPWLAPEPNRGKRNEPAWVAETARVVAGLLGVEPEEIASATTKNFSRLFHLQADVGNW